MKNYKWMLLLCVCLSVLTACNNTDNVQQIFTGKTWKLSVIKYAGTDKECKDYWVEGGVFNQAKFEASNKILKDDKSSFTLEFSGTAIGEEINGKAKGKAYTVSFNDVSWKANGRSNDFSMAIKTTTDKDVLATAFLNALSNATSYGGNDGNLYIYFTEGQQSKYMLFHVQR